MGLVAVHGHSLRVAAQLAVGRRADGPAAGATTVCAALLQGEKLLGTESLVVGLRGGLNEILEMGAEEEVAQVDEFAVSLVLDVNDAPAVLATANLLAVDNDRLLRADDGEGYKALRKLVFVIPTTAAFFPGNTYLDLAVQGALLVIKLLVIIREHLEVVESKLLLDALLELLALLDSQGVSLGNDRDNVDDI